MKRNGGYIIIDLSITGANLVKLLEQAYKLNKPVLAIINGVTNYCYLTMDGNYYRLTTERNEVYSIFSYTGQLTTEVLIAQYKHIMSFTGTIGGTSRTFVIEIVNKHKEAYTSVNSALIAVANYGYTSATKSALVKDNDAFTGLLYVTGTSTKTANYKYNGADSYATIQPTNLTLSDSVIDYSTIMG